MANILTSRQNQCVQYLLEGKTAKETASILGLSSRTVEYYLNNIKSKLGCNNKAQLILKVGQLMAND